MTTDRWPEALHASAPAASPLSAQAKGAGMIEPGFATMLCFVQTDAVVDGPRRRAARRRRRLLRADHRRRPDEHQRHRAAAGDRRRRARRCPTGLLDAVLLQLALEIVADGEGATRVGRVEVSEAADGGGGRAGRPGDRQLAAGQDRALRPRPQLGPDRPGGRDGARRRGARGARRRPRSTPPSSAPRRAEAEIGAAARPRRARAPTSASRDLDLRVHADQRGVHDMSDEPSTDATTASRRCSRRCPTSGSSTAARW